MLRRGGVVLRVLSRFCSGVRMQRLLCAAAFYRCLSLQTLHLQNAKAHRQMLANGAPCEFLVIPCASAHTRELARAAA